ncbi:hypothetical protein NPIL_367741, partial [Nephila pilipes]
LDKDFHDEQLGEILKDMKFVNEDIQDLINDEDYERDIADCEKNFDTAKLALFYAKPNVSANLPLWSSDPPRSIERLIGQKFDPF